MFRVLELLEAQLVVLAQISVRFLAPAFELAQILVRFGVPVVELAEVLGLSLDLLQKFFIFLP